MLQKKAFAATISVVVLLFTFLAFPSQMVPKVEASSVKLSGCVLQACLDDGSGSTAADSSGNGRTGTLINSPVWNATGKYGGCISFGGGSCYINYTQNAYQMGITTAGTFAAWTTKGHSNYHAIMGDYSGGSGFEVRTGGDGTMTFWVVNPGAKIVTNSSAIPDDGWHYIVCTFNSTRMDIYIDGVLFSDLATSSAVMGNPAASYKIMSRGDLGDIGGSGSIDEVQMYNRCISASEVATLYANAASTVSITVTSSPTGSGYITVNGSAQTAPYTIASANVGDVYTIAANSPVRIGWGNQYVFSSWNDSGAQSHSYTVSVAATITASFTQKLYIINGVPVNQITSIDGVPISQIYSVNGVT